MIYILLFFVLALLPLVSFVIFPFGLNEKPEVSGPHSVPRYQVVGREVYFAEESGERLLLPSAAAKTFQSLSIEKQSQVIYSQYGRDHQYVYFRDQIIACADPAAFRVVDVNLGKDQLGVFRNGKLLSSDPKNFKYLGGDLWKDSEHVYCKGHVISSQPGSFRFVATVGDDMYFKDANQVFINGKPVEVKDASSLEYAGNGVFKDRFSNYQFVDGVATRRDQEPVSATKQFDPFGEMQERFMKYYVSEFPFHFPKLYENLLTLLG